MTMWDWPNYTAEWEGAEGHVTKMNSVIHTHTHTHTHAHTFPPEETHSQPGTCCIHTWLTKLHCICKGVRNWLYPITSMEARRKCWETGQNNNGSHSGGKRWRETVKSKEGEKDLKSHRCREEKISDHLMREVAGKGFLSVEIPFQDNVFISNRLELVVRILFWRCEVLCEDPEWH